MITLMKLLPGVKACKKILEEVVEAFIEVILVAQELHKSTFKK